MGTLSWEATLSFSFCLPFIFILPFIQWEVNFKGFFFLKNRPLLKGVQHLGKQTEINTSSFHGKNGRKHEDVPMQMYAH